MENVVNNKLAYSVKEFSEAFDISQSLTRKLLKNGRLPYIRVGERILIPAKTLEDILEGRINL